MSIELSKELKEKIKKDCNNGVVNFPDCEEDKAYNNGYRDGYKEGATEYAEKWQAAEEKAELYEKALNAILNTNHDNYEKVIHKVKAIATEALTPKASTDE